ncbi:MAG: DUF3781 domain-containing protein [Clostridiales bacterium]|nr:DUF3781 domain-containing protein [Clostridiales bacterium]
MGVERIRRNLNLTTDNVVSRRKDATTAANIIIRRGKNLYAYKTDAAITVNAKSLTIITAHKIRGG